MPPVVVIGAGPAGCSAALTLASRGVETLILERRRLPRPKTCAGGLSPWTLGWLGRHGLREAIEAEAYPIAAARIWAAGAGPIELRGRGRAAVLPRHRLDQRLIEAALAAGAALREEVTARGIVRDGAHLVGVETDRGLIEAGAVVVASGALGRLSPLPDRQRFFGVMTRCRGMKGIDDALDIFVDPALGLQYGWVFPEGPEVANLGVCFQRGRRGPNARVLLDRFMDRYLHARLAGGELDRVQAHPIRALVRSPRLVDEGVIYAGEAAGLVDPLTGEGIYYALRSGELAGRCLAGRLRRKRPATRAALAAYAATVALRLTPRLAGLAALARLLRSPAARLIHPLLSRPVVGLVEKVYSRL